jgi:hypothetical protein
MGIIYEILCWTTGLRYIGQTIHNIRIRITKHKYEFNKGTLRCSSRLVLEHGNYEIYELEKVEDESLLKKRETYYIEHTDCVNIHSGNYRQTEKYKEAAREAVKRCREKKKNLKNREL